MKTKALMKLIGVVLLIPIHLFLSLIGSALVLSMIVVFAITMGWISDTLITLFDKDFPLFEMIFVVCWLVLAAFFFGRVNGKLF